MFYPKIIFLRHRPIANTIVVTIRKKYNAELVNLNSPSLIFISVVTIRIPKDIRTILNSQIIRFDNTLVRDFTLDKQ